MVKPNYNHSILNVSASFLKHYNIPTKHSTIGVLDKHLQNTNHIIYILLDGLGVNVIKEHLKPSDSLYKYMVDEVTSVFPPTTVAATTSVLSIEPPITNGHIGWVQYFEKEDTNNVVFLNEDYYTHQTHQENLKEKYLAFENIAEKIYKHTKIDSTIYFPSFVPNGSNSFLEEIEKVLVKTHNVDQSFNYLYWTEPDLSTHMYGTKSKEVYNVINSLNKDFDHLIENIPSDTIVTLIADHGLTDIEEIPFYQYDDLFDLLKRNPSLEPRCANFFVKDGQKQEFESLFNRYFANDYKLYTKEEFINSGLIGYGKKHNMLDSMLGDFIAISKENKMFIFNESKGYIAHHAGLSADEMMVPLIIVKK